MFEIMVQIYIKNQMVKFLKIAGQESMYHQQVELIVQLRIQEENQSRFARRQREINQLRNFNVQRRVESFLFMSTNSLGVSGNYSAKVRKS